MPGSHKKIREAAARRRGELAMSGLKKSPLDTGNAKKPVSRPAWRMERDETDRWQGQTRKTGVPRIPKRKKDY